MNGGAKLSYAQIMSMADQLHSASGNMETVLTEIKALFDQVGNEEVWSGTAASETRSEFDALSQKLQGFYESVESCHSYLLKVVENYQAVDNVIRGE